MKPTRGDNDVLSFSYRFSIISLSFYYHPDSHLIVI